MIVAYSLYPSDGEVERNLKSVKESKIKEVKLFEEYDPRLEKVRKNLPECFKEKLIHFLKKYHECFAWFVANMPIINPDINSHKLAIDLGIKSIQQKKRCHGQDHLVVIKVKNDKLLKVGFIEEAP